jgi:hypothetical protein
MEPRRPSDQGFVWGLFLIGLGVLFLLQTTGFVHLMWDAVISLAFCGAAATFLLVFLRDRSRWWALFPAFVLGFIGLEIGLDWMPASLDWSGTLFLGGLGLIFCLVHGANPREVWPIIPGGVLLTLAAVNLVDDLAPRLDTGWLFFLGLAATFALVYYRAPDRTRHGWALIVAAVLGGIGALTFIGAMMRVLLPLFLILLGVYLLTNRRFPSKGP